MSTASANNISRYGSFATSTRGSQKRVASLANRTARGPEPDEVYDGHGIAQCCQLTSLSNSDGVWRFRVLHKTELRLLWYGGKRTGRWRRGQHTGRERCWVRMGEGGGMRRNATERGVVREGVEWKERRKANESVSVSNQWQITIRPVRGPD